MIHGFHKYIFITSYELGSVLVARDTVVQDSSSRHRPWRQTGKQAIIHNCTIMRLEMILRILGGGGVCSSPVAGAGFPEVVMV